MCFIESSLDFEMYELYDEESDENKQRIVGMFKNGISKLIQDINSISIDMEPESAQSVPVTTPLEFINISQHGFRLLLREHQSRLKLTYGDEVLNVLFKERTNLRVRFNEDLAFRRRVESSKRQALRTGMGAL
jgi:hypothetical protein